MTPLYTRATLIWVAFALAVCVLVGTATIGQGGRPYGLIATVILLVWLNGFFVGRVTAMRWATAQLREICKGLREATAANRASEPEHRDNHV